MLQENRELIYLDVLTADQWDIKLSFVTFRQTPTSDEKRIFATTCSTIPEDVILCADGITWPALDAARQEFQNTPDQDVFLQRQAQYGNLVMREVLRDSEQASRTSHPHLLEAVEMYHHQFNSLRHHQDDYTFQMEDHPLWKKLAAAHNLRVAHDLHPVFGAMFSFAQSLQVAPALWQAVLWYRQLDRDREKVWKAADLKPYAETWLGEYIDPTQQWGQVIGEYLRYLARIGVVHQDNGWYVGSPLRGHCPCAEWIKQQKRYQETDCQWDIIRDVAMKYRIDESIIAHSVKVSNIYHPPPRSCSETCPRLKKVEE